MGNLSAKVQMRIKRKKRLRKKFFGTFERPRMSVFRSAKHIYAQIIDDVQGRTIIAVSTLEKDVVNAMAGFKGKLDIATYVGKILAERAVEKGIKKVVFDRNGFLYHGRVKALAEGARKHGLDF